jgi:hypothetical protein
VEGEIIILDRRNWSYLSVNDSGAALWPLMVEGTDRAALVEALRATFGIDERQAQADVAAFLRMLADHDLLEDSAQEPSR